MERRSLAKPALSIVLVLALQWGALAMALPRHASAAQRRVHAAHAMDSECGRHAGAEVPAAPAAQEPGPGCCDALGPCPLQMAVAAAAVLVLPTVSSIVFQPLTKSGLDRDVPPDPFPPRR